MNEPNIPNEIKKLLAANKTELDELRAIQSSEFMKLLHDSAVAKLKKDAASVALKDSQKQFKPGDYESGYKMMELSVAYTKAKEELEVSNEKLINEYMTNGTPF